MHPLVARIHPSFRTAFLAFIVSRAALWLGLNASGRLTFEPGEFGTPLFRALSDLSPNPFFFAAFTELLLFAGLVALYRFARRDGMPQTADRATWLWIASPAMVFALPGSDYIIAYALAAIAMGAILRPVWSMLALSLTIMIRPEAVVIWPAIAWAWWAYRDDDPLDRLFLAVLPAVAFAGTVLWGIFIGEPHQLLSGEASWRSDFAWHGFWHHTEDLMVGGLLLAALVIAVRMLDDTPRGWFWVVAPVLVLVGAHAPAFAGLAALPFAVPLYVQLAKFAQDTGFERVLLTASIAALTLLAAT